jgi:hypothetical protein
MKERRIERRLIAAQDKWGFRNAAVIRRCSVGRGFGIIDMVLLPRTGRYKLVLVEAKRSLAPDAAGKVVGQLLLYHSQLSRLGTEGLEMMRAYCARHASRARGVRRKSLQAIAGVRPADRAWRRLRKGRPLSARQIALYIALEAEASSSLKSLLKSLSRSYGLKIRVVTVVGGRRLSVWAPA